VLLTVGGFSGGRGVPFQQESGGPGSRCCGDKASTTESAAGLRVGIGHHEGYYIIATRGVSTKVRDLQQPFYISETNRARLITGVPKYHSAFSVFSGLSDHQWEMHVLAGRETPRLSDAGRYNALRSQFLGITTQRFSAGESHGNKRRPLGEGVS
jgi:hypothetical protein